MREEKSMCVCVRAVRRCVEKNTLQTNPHTHTRKLAVSEKLCVDDVVAAVCHTITCSLIFYAHTTLALTQSDV